jgi:hypothetical protein
VYLAPGGSVTNAATASITGGTLGVRISGGTGIVANDGSVGATGTSGIGVALYAGGSVSNAAGGSITGAAAGVNIAGGAGTLVNAGVIGGAASGGSGVNLFLGGSVTNAGSGLIGGAIGVYVAGDAGTVLNSGSIAASVGFGVNLFAGGYVSNAAAGSVTGTTLGIVVSNHAGTVVNDGRITVTYTYGLAVALHAGGSVTNNAAGSIVGGAAGAYGVGGGVNVVNDGVIEGTHGTGVALLSAGSVTNGVSGLIAGAFEGVQLGVGGTLTNLGTIIGNSGTAVAFVGGYASRLVLAPGFGFSGKVVASPSASNTLELASGGATGTVTGLGSLFSNFGTIAFDPGARWFVAGDTLGLAGTIEGFTVGDTIELNGITATGSSYAGGMLTLDDVSGTVALDVPGSFTIADFIVSDVADGTEVTVSCFRAGTRIRSARGEVPVERLRVGESVLADAGDGAMRWRPVVWIGHRAIDCRRHPRPRQVWPVRIAAGAFGRGKPRCDLLLSPDHAVFIGGVLIPVRHLIDDVVIAQVPTATVTYFHVELAMHAILLAEGLPVESYLDTGGRADFAGGGKTMTLHPEFAARTWEGHGCAPLVVTGPELAAARGRTRAKAAARVYAAAVGTPAR